MVEVYHIYVSKTSKRLYNVYYKKDLIPKTGSFFDPKLVKAVFEPMFLAFGQEVENPTDDQIDALIELVNSNPIIKEGNNWKIK